MCLNITQEDFSKNAHKYDFSWQCSNCRIVMARRGKKDKVVPQPKQVSQNGKANLTKDMSIQNTCMTSTPTTSYMPLGTSGDTILRTTKHKVNISVQNSFNSLSSEENLEDENIFESIVSVDNSKLNRSCPEIKLNHSTETIELKEKISLLVEKLTSAENEIENLLNENCRLQEKVDKCEEKIVYLTNICKDPRNNCNNLKKKYKKTEKKWQNNTLPACNNLESTLDISKNCNKCPDPITSTCRVEQAVQEDTRQKPHHPSTKHRVLLLADETGRGLRNVLEKCLGNDYTVFSLLKPYTNLKQIISGGLSYCKDFTKSDYIIIFAGSHDKNLIEYQSALYYCLNIFGNTNVLYGKTIHNKYFNESKLNDLIRMISMNIENLHYSDASYFRNNRLDKFNTCRMLILDIIAIEHKRIIRDSQRTVSIVSTRNIETQTESEFFRK